MTEPDYPFADPDLPIDERVADLMARLDLVEKSAQLLHQSPAIPRLGVPAYNWWNEALHGVARAGIATVFPQAIGLAAMWSEQRLRAVAVAISDEARAKHHEFLRRGDHGMYKGLTFWTPNINIFRDPRWGRGQETYGECPFLTARLGVVMCQGLQGDDPKYLKLVATPKHFAVHSGPESLRHSFDARVSDKDLAETYLPAFFACVTEGKAASVMGAYNRVNGEVCCGSPTLLERILRQGWGFDGYVVSDCWAIRDFHEHHRVTADFGESAALAIREGCDLNCGCTFEHLPMAVQNGQLSEALLDRSLARVLRARMRLGMFDPEERVPFANIPYEVVDCEAHQRLALEAARASLVLLKNDRQLLPLPPDLSRIAVIGPNANQAQVLVGNYFGHATHLITPLEGIRRAVGPKTRVLYTDGCKLTGIVTDGLGRSGNLSEAVSVAMRAEVVVLCLGLSAEIEGEEGDVSNPEAAGDRVGLHLPGLQQELMEKVVALNKPTILVVLAGSPVDLSFADQKVGAILYAWYPGAEGGTAIADVLFGKINPAGRLPITFPNRVEDLPDFTSYSMKGRTYRYLEKEPRFPFGFGLSFTRFEYSRLGVLTLAEGLEVRVTVTNLGERDGEEVVQLYLATLDAPCRVPHHELRGFERVAVKAKSSIEVRFCLGLRDLAYVDERGWRIFQPGRFRISVGGSQPDPRSVELMSQAPLSWTGSVEAAPQQFGFCR